MSLMSKTNSSLVTYFTIAVSLYEKFNLTFRISECASMLLSSFYRDMTNKETIYQHLNIPNKKISNEI